MAICFRGHEDNHRQLRLLDPFRVLEVVIEVLHGSSYELFLWFVFFKENEDIYILNTHMYYYVL